MSISIYQDNYLYNLLKIFPIEKPDKTINEIHWTICGHELPHLKCFQKKENDIYNHHSNKELYPRLDKEKIATALGLVCQLMCMIGKYLGV